MKVEIIGILALSQGTLGLIGELPFLASPVVHLDIGSDPIRIMMPNILNQTCAATVTFQDENFIPLTSIASPHNCSGQQVAEINLPSSVPNGAASLTLTCEGSDAASRTEMNLCGGCSDVESYEQELSGVVAVVSCMKRGPTSTPPPPRRR